MRSNIHIEYDDAFALKQLGFENTVFHYHWDHTYDESYEDVILNTEIKRDKCVGNWNNMASRVSVPTYQEAFDWFLHNRTGHNKWVMFSWIEPFLSTDEGVRHEAKIWRRGDYISVGIYNTIDEARPALLKKLVEIANT